MLLAHCECMAEENHPKYSPNQSWNQAAAFVSCDTSCEWWKAQHETNDGANAAILAGLL
jgi:hypothetical protein